MGTNNTLGAMPGVIWNVREHVIRISIYRPWRHTKQQRCILPQVKCNLAKNLGTHPKLKDPASC